jgi:tRNA U54 and U55 pseudouridine synthase Pus10
LPAKSRPRHRERSALVYIRQSTPQQVTNRRESLARQYALAEHAKS